MSSCSLLFDNYALGLVLISLLIYLVLRNAHSSKANASPGPKGWPLLGYLPFILNRPDEIVEKLSKQYGHVFSFPLGSQNVVVLNSFESIKEAYVKQGDIFVGKPTGFKVLDYGMDNLGIFSEEGELWKEQRAFAISTLREFGLGKITLEDKVLEECDAIVEEISKLNGKPLCVTPLFISAAANVIFSVLFGERWQHGDPDFKRWIKLATDYDIAFSVIPAMDFFPFISKLPHWLNGLNVHDKLKKEFEKYNMKKVKKQMKTFDETNLRGYVDCFLKEMYKRNPNGDSNHVFSMPRLMSNVIAFDIAGTVTTGMTLSWAIHLLIRHPEIKKKLVEEIDRVVGNERKPSWTDRPNMPMTEAVLLEAQRIADLVPLGVPRSNSEAANVMGYDIPKRSIIFANFKSMHSNPELWGDPEKFRPERFIDPKTGKCMRPEYLMPFGTGRRFCPGETLARMNMFLILTTVFQKFYIEPAANGLNTDNSPNILASGMVRYLEPFDICAKLKVNN